MAVLFVSDLHLKPERPDITQAFLYFITNIANNADALYLLGDIFEAWIGDDAPTPGNEQIFHELKQLSESGRPIYFQHGNRDFLVGEQFAKYINAQLLPEQVVHEFPLTKAVILHGDQLCTADKEYMQFRSLVRNPLWQKDFLAKPIPERLAIAKQLRDASQQSTSNKPDEITDVTHESVKNVFLETGVDLMIHGHTHRPAVHQIDLDDKQVNRIVLGDWDSFGWYLKLDESGYELIKFDLATAAASV